ncbi:MAG TPA: hypothetical protein VJV05_14655 [Pyrinomonadaceae bacterium]|nr:hypothetical protein [Pyrinomonadaceae bacterium]
MTRIALILIALILGTGVADAQTKRRPRPEPKTPVVSPSPTPTPTDEPEPVVTKSESKKNERPANGNTPPVSIKQTASDPTYYYQFTQPDFDINKIVIEHDETGKGTITFTKKLFGDTVTDPLLVSSAALERINAAYTTLNFLDSNESYQYEKDYSHLGVMTFRMKREAKQRSTTFNYTVNKDAKVLADEYRKLSNQYVWIFDINVARENQSLDAPRLLDSLDSFYRRKELSDPTQMVPLLKELTNDERIPLIARNHADRLIKQIEKGKK